MTPLLSYLPAALSGFVLFGAMCVPRRPARQHRRRR